LSKFLAFFLWTSSDRLGEGAGSGLTSPAIGLTRGSVGNIEVESYRFDFCRYRGILLAESDFDYCACFWEYDAYDHLDYRYRWL